MTLHIDCWFEPQDGLYKTEITHTILTSYNRECDKTFSQVKFYSIESLIYPGLKEKEMDLDSSCVIEPDFTFIKGIHINKNINKSYINTYDGNIIKYELLTIELFEYLQESLMLVD